MINSHSINGKESPSWVIQATVAATAIAVAASCVSVKIVNAAVTANAVVSAEVQQTKTTQGNANALASTGSNVVASSRFAGAVNASAGAFGSCFVIRKIPAEANGQASCLGQALMAQAIGEASSNASCTVIDAKAHIRHPANVVASCSASGSISSVDITRKTTVTGQASVSHIAEASRKANGNSYFNHDGHATGLASSTGSIDQDKTKIIATIGAFDFGNSSGTANAFQKYPGIASANASLTANQPVAKKTCMTTIQATASASVTAIATKIRSTTVSGVAEAGFVSGKALMKHAAKAVGNAIAQAIQAIPLKTIRITNVANTATASLATEIIYGVQYFGIANGSASITAQVNGKATHYAGVQDVIASSISVTAFAVTNADVMAPEERYMVVEKQDRELIVGPEDRLMMVTA